MGANTLAGAQFDETLKPRHRRQCHEALRLFAITERLETPVTNRLQNLEHNGHKVPVIARPRKIESTEMSHAVRHTQTTCLTQILLITSTHAQIEK
jgi:hypothetical protein